eukprot:15472398-Alexandrium_andersonii.AAC.1
MPCREVFPRAPGRRTWLRPPGHEWEDDWNVSAQGILPPPAPPPPRRDLARLWATTRAAQTSSVPA